MFLAYSLRSRIYCISLNFLFLFSFSGKSNCFLKLMNSEVMQQRKADVFIPQFLCILPIDVFVNKNNFVYYLFQPVCMYIYMYT
jgi:hypothetical protein